MNKTNKIEIKPKRIRNLKAARRLLADLIYYLQTDSMADSKAKSIAYLLIKYGELSKLESFENLTEFEERIKSLEEKLNEKPRPSFD